MIRIAQASSSETFGKYGKAPNQRRTGASRTKPEGNLDGELNIVDWYGGWEAVYRPIDGEVAERIAEFMYNAVANGYYIGYSWDGGTQLYDALRKKNSTNPKDIDTFVNTDCAKLIGDAVWFSGIKSDALHNLVTWRMDNVLMSTNAFIKLTDTAMLNNGKGIRRGDILLKAGHTAVALDSDPVTPSGQMFVFKRFDFNGVYITAGTAGTRAAQRTMPVAKKGYRALPPSLYYVNNSSLANVKAFFGWGDNNNKLTVNFYRASGASGTMNVTVEIVYVREDVTVVS
jgi:hypothetical protein